MVDSKTRACKMQDKPTVSHGIRVKKSSKNDRGVSKRYSSFERALNAQMWENLSSKINNNTIGS